MRYPVARKIISCFISAGFINSLYLFYSHLKNYTDISYQSFCALTKSINCDTVSQSPWSVFLGIPLSMWGIIAYLFLFVLSVSPLFDENRKGRGWPLILFFSALFSLFNIFLAFISAYKIKSFCIMCILSYAISFFLFYISYKSLKEFNDQKFSDSLIKDMIFIKDSLFFKLSVSVFIIALILIYTLMPKYWIMSSFPMTEGIKHGFEKDTGHPWIGSESPALTVYEYTDYMCFQCRKMHQYLRKLVAANPDRIRLVHMNYPMDHSFNDIVVPESFHEGAGNLALLSEYASDRDDFWKINDALFEVARLRGEIKYDKISELTGLSKSDIAIALNHEYFRKRLSIDILTGMKKMILATPSYVINDVVYEGTIPPEVFSKAGIE